MLSYSVPVTQFLLLSSRYSVPVTQFPLLSSRYSVPVTQFPLLSSRYSLLGVTMSIDTFAPLAESKKTSYKLVPPKDIRINIDRNVRELGVYNPNHHAMKPLIQSMLSVGFAEGNPCTVVAENGFYDLLQGHRRYTAACEAIRLRDAMSAEDRVKIPEIKGIPCIVMTGLSESDKLQVIVDHGNIATLNDIEKLECVRRLVHAGMGRAQIAAKMGESASWVQLRMELITLPPSVHKEWVKHHHNKSLPAEKRETLTFPVGWSDIKELHTASVEDKKQGVIDVATGSSFRKVLGDLKVKGVTGTRRGSKEEGGAYNSAQIRNLANACHRAWLKRLFLYLAGDNQSGSINDIITNLELAHDAKFGEPDSLEETERKNAEFAKELADTAKDVVTVLSK